MPRRSVVLVLAVLLACSSSPAEPQLVGEGRRVLFIGNSYTYLMDIPGIVQALADSAGGDRLAVATVAGPDMALVDHWSNGTALREIKKGGWEWVVLQQGPSSTALNRDTLIIATRQFGTEITGVSARPALFSAWPSQARRQDFDRAIESYTLAAAEVNGLFLPIASAWLAAWRRDSTLRLYSDGLHPSIDGAYLTALVIYARLLGKSPIGLPNRVKLRSGTVVSLPDNLATLLQEAAHEVAGPFSPDRSRP
jgi:hypothetical protein